MRLLPQQRLLIELLSTLTLLALLACQEEKAAEPRRAGLTHVEQSAHPVVVRVRKARVLFEEAKGRAWPPLSKRVTMAYAGIQRGHFKRARSMLQQELDENPQSGAAIYLLGCAWYREQQYAAAIPYFEKTLEIGPSFAGCESVLYRYGRCLYNLGDAVGSRSAALAYLKLNQGNADALFLLGLADIEEADLEAAIAHFKEALAGFEANDSTEHPTTGDIAKCHARLGDVYLQQGKLARAQTELQRCISLYPAHYEPYFMLSRVLTRLGETEAAQHAMDQFLARKKQAGR